MAAATNIDMKNLKFLKFLLITIYQTNYGMLIVNQDLVLER